MNLHAGANSALLKWVFNWKPFFVSVLLYMTRFKVWGDKQLTLVCFCCSNKHYKSNYWWVISHSYNDCICSFVLCAHTDLQACLLFPFCLLKTITVWFWPFWTFILLFQGIIGFSVPHFQILTKGYIHYFPLWSHKGTSWTPHTEISNENLLVENLDWKVISFSMFEHISLLRFL